MFFCQSAGILPVPADSLEKRVVTWYDKEAFYKANSVPRTIL